MKALIATSLLLICGTVYGQISVEVKGLTKHHAPAPPARYRKDFPPAWPCEIVGYPSLPYGQEQILLTSQDSGRTWKSSGSLCVSDFTTYRLVTARFAHAQQPQKPSVEPIPYKLNLEASKAMTETFQALANEEARHNAEVKRVTEIQGALMKGAGIPESEWSKRVFKPNPDGSLAFVMKEEAAAKTGQPK